MFGPYGWACLSGRSGTWVCQTCADGPLALRVCGFYSPQQGPETPCTAIQFDDLESYGFTLHLQDATLTLTGSLNERPDGRVVMTHKELLGPDQDHE